MQVARRPKHVEISEHLASAIAKGDYQEGDRLPSESELVEQFSASRPTVARALRELQHAGLIERRVGSGTFVRQTTAATPETGRKLFGLMIPELGKTEIFEPICGQIARQAQAQGHALVWSDCSSDGSPEDPATDPGSFLARAQAACRQFIEQRVAGVFCAPVEFATHGANLKILRELEAAGIPVVLLDRDVAAFPDRSHYDLIGVDNPCGGFIITRHLVQAGRKRICFFARPGSANTIGRRVTGYREALFQAGLPIAAEDVAWGDPLDPRFVRDVVTRRKPDAFVCGNDIVAASLMQTLMDLGVNVPREVAVVGFDDVKYARLLGVPLTTMRQPCEEMGKAAMTCMLERIANPTMAARSILLPTTLVVRKSCGAA